MPSRDQDSNDIRPPLDRGEKGLEPRRTNVLPPPGGSPFRPQGAPPPHLRARSTKIFGAASEHRPLVSQPMAQQPRRTHVFINPAVSVAIQSPGASPLIQEPRRTKLFNPNTIPRFETPSLSRRLREETMTELDRAKNAKFVRDLLEGELSRERYCQFLACIHEIYTVLEWLLERHRDHPVAGRFYMPHLFRAQAVQQDLDYFLRGRPLEPVRDLAPVRGWIQRLTYISDNHPELLAAHAYVRYMRELCGCEEAAERVARTFRLSLDAPEGGAPRGLAYHYFKGLRDLDAARADFRARLDGIPTELVEEDDFLREARRAFTLNYAMVLELV